MEQIKISLPEVSSTAQAIRSYNHNLDNVLSYVSKTMNSLDSVWQSTGEETLLARFNHFANKFVTESEVIESYAKYLDDIVNNYDTLETTITANAANFD